MTFLQDLISSDKNIKIGITNLLSNITTRDGSHKGGWARLLKCQITNMGYKNVKILTNKDSLNSFDVIVFDLGAEYSGALNMFGGLDEKVYKRLTEIKDFPGPIYSWKNDVPSVTSLESRRKNVSTCQQFKDSDPDFLQKVQLKLDRCQTFRHAYVTSALLIGDSHTPSVWDPSYMIERQDGRTLFGALKESVISELVQKLNPETVMIHMSSIDVRHHLMRQPDPVQSTVQLVMGLVNQLTPLWSFFNVKKIIVSQTMGIEDESRELPKTGFYKGTPFFGTWQERNTLRSAFNEMLEECSKFSGYEVLKFPSHFFDEDGKLKFSAMEVPGSVHLSPEFYRWNLDANQLRWDR